MHDLRIFDAVKKVAAVRFQKAVDLLDRLKPDEIRELLEIIKAKQANRD